LLFFVIIVFYPLYFVVVASFSDPYIVNSGKMLLWPEGFNLIGYSMVFENKDIWRGYANTIFYTVCGTSLGVSCVVLAGFAFSRKDLPGRGFLMTLFIITMYFGGGLIPTFAVIKSLGLLNTRLLLVLLGSVSAYNIIVVRSFMLSTIPDELSDAARIDGCGMGRFFCQIVLPLSKAIIAVMVLYIAVGYWNSYFNAMVYIQDSSMHPLQLELRQQLLIANTMTQDQSNMDPEYLEKLQHSAMLIKYSLIVIATAPILCVYPFVQKFFVKGIMVGSVKG